MTAGNDVVSKLIQLGEEDKREQPWKKWMTATETNEKGPKEIVKIIEGPINALTNVFPVS
jgi:hypothetical protein